MEFDSLIETSRLWAQSWLRLIRLGGGVCQTSVGGVTVEGRAGIMGGEYQRFDLKMIPKSEYRYLSINFICSGKLCA